MAITLFRHSGHANCDSVTTFLLVLDERKHSQATMNAEMSSQQPAGDKDQEQLC